MRMNRVSYWFYFIVIGAVVLGAGVSGIAQESEEQNGAADHTNHDSTRDFRFVYSGTIRGIPGGSTARVWIPIAQSDEHQEIISVKWQLPVEAAIFNEKVYGNRILYFEYATAEEADLPFSVEYRARRSEVAGLEAASDSKLDETTRQRFLAADRLVPVDGKPLELMADVSRNEEPIEQARAIYNRVDDHMTYDKSRPGYGNGDSIWACESGIGNCTDFHSLFISMARGSGLPARFEMGFSLPEEAGSDQIGGYHCWASVFIEGKGWVPVDISEADKHPDLKHYYFGNLSVNRIGFTMGRDIDLEPAQEGPPLNYLIYPYVEIDGRPMTVLPADLEFQVTDVTGEERLLPPDQ